MYKKLVLDLIKLPELVKETLSKQNDIQVIARDFITAKGTMYLGRGYSYPIAMEGALKLKELSYIHAEGYPAGEMKHGPLALIEDGMPVIVLAPKDRFFEKTISNMQEVIARGGKIFFITDNKKDISNDISDEIDGDIRSAIGESVKLISRHLNIDAIVVMTESGSTAIVVSHYRPRNNIFALTTSESICRKLSLVWGIIPILAKKFESTDEMIEESEKIKNFI